MSFWGFFFWQDVFRYKYKQMKPASYREQLNQLYIGMTKQQLIQRVGPPNSKKAL